MLTNLVKVDGRNVIGTGVLFANSGEKFLFYPFSTSRSEVVSLEVVIDENANDTEFKFEKKDEYLNISFRRQWRSGSEASASNLVLANDASTEFIELRFSVLLIGTVSRYITKISYCILESEAYGADL